MTLTLITGAFGQVGTEILDYLLASIDTDIIATDINVKGKNFENERVTVDYLDVKDRVAVNTVMKKYKPDYVFHLAAILSASGEKNPILAYDVNLTGTLNVLNGAAELNTRRVFVPSTIGIYGPEIRKDKAPQENCSIPRTMYGITKYSSEMLFLYFAEKFSLDVRSIRYPGLISYKTPPTAGTTDYAVDMIMHAARGENYKCYLKGDTRLPMMYMEDAMSSAMKLFFSNSEKIKKGYSYNIMSYSITPMELQDELREIFPNFKVEYEPDYRQQIAESWPESIDIRQAENDWGFKPQYDLKKTVRDFISNV
ncbi:NAD-dependent epimerase/dehydratase family protein [Caldiplasma sukawensis]